MHGAGSGRHSLSTYQRSISVVITIAIVVGIGVWLRANGAEAVDAATKLNPAVLVVGLTATMAGSLIAAYAWWVIVKGLGAELPAWNAVTICLAGQLGKYLPGSLWPALMQAELAERQRVPRRIVVTGFAISLAASLCAGAVVGSLVLVSSGSAVAPTVPGIAHGWAVAGATALCVAFTATVLFPGVVVSILTRALSRWIEPASISGLDRSALRNCLVLSVLGWVVTGLHVWSLAVSLGADPLSALPIAIGGLAAATVIGSLALLSPGGLGVREVVLIACLGAILPLPSAVVLAAASRLLTLVGECGLTLLTFLLTQRSSQSIHHVPA